MRMVLNIAMLLAAGLMLVDPVEAGAGGRRYERQDTPVKDCTRWNGTYGYYGNQWCSRAEQIAFDRWDAQRQARRRWR